MTVFLSITALLILLAVLGNYLIFNGKLKASKKLSFNLPAEQITAAIVALRRFAEWSPWLQLDRETKVTFSDAPDHPQGSLSLESTKLGSYTLTNLAIDDNSVTQLLKTTHPYRYTAQLTWQLTPDGASTEVTWELDGQMTFLWRSQAKRFAHALAGDFHFGLAQLRQLLDTAAPKMQVQYPGINVFPAMTYAIMPFAGSFAQMRETMQSNYPKLIAAAGETSTADFMSAAIYQKVNLQTQHVEMELAVPTDKTSVEGYACKSYPAGLFCQVVLQGSYDFLDLAWTQAFAYLRANKLKFDRRRLAMDLYHKTPSNTTNPDEYVTSLYLPVKE